MKPRGEDTSIAIREWIKDEIKSSPGIRNHLGKFFFGVTSGTIGVLISLEKLSEYPEIDLCLTLSFIMLFISIFIGLIMVIPPKIKLTGETDLYNLHKKLTKRNIIYIITWFIFWIIGLSMGIIAVI